MREILTALFEAGGVVLIAAIGYGAKYVAGWLKREGILTELETKRKYAEIVVSAAEQMFQEADGETKLKKAQAELIQYLNEKNIDVTEQELRQLIESAVNAMKQGAAEGALEIAAPDNEGRYYSWK